MNKEIKMLYRKDNTKARGHINQSVKHARYDRNTKEGLKKSMLTAKGSTKSGRDYTPLFMFLLSKVGQKWDVVFSEAASRLDDKDAVWYVVAQYEEEKNGEDGVICTGESSYFSQLCVDDDGFLQKVNPNFSNEMLYPSCPCCTHTFNGKPFVNKYVDYEMVMPKVKPTVILPKT